MFGTRMRNGIYFIFLLAVGVACRQLETATQCFSNADCGAKGVCLNGDCQGGKIDGIETESHADIETDTAGCVMTPDALDTEPQDSGEECCTALDSIRQCWQKDADLDGVTCDNDSDCLSGQCDEVRGVCACTLQEECNDGQDRLGYCNVSAGYCGPSLCNGYQACACFGGCMAWTLPALEGDERCCEGVYSIDPGDK
jgi:hypothetical protein